MLLSFDFNQLLRSVSTCDSFICLLEVLLGLVAFGLRRACEPHVFPWLQ